MNFYNIMEAGATIVIEDEKGYYDPAKFWIKNGKLFTWAPEFGTLERNNKDFPVETLESHFNHMLDLGLKLTITR